MVEIVDLDKSSYYRPPAFPGLKKLVRFPDGEFKHSDIPNSTVWIFDNKEHRYVKEIHMADTGCGMAAFLIKPVDHKVAADRIYTYLNGQNVLGRGNHFVDICSAIESLTENYQPHQVLVVHSDGKGKLTEPATSLEDALIRQERAKTFRE